MMFGGTSFLAACLRVPWDEILSFCFTVDGAWLRLGMEGFGHIAIIDSTRRQFYHGCAD